MTTVRLLFAAAPTARSQAYAQAMRAAGIGPLHVLMCGHGGGVAERPGPRTAMGIALPDLREPLESTCRDAGWSVEATEACSMNDPRVIERIAAADPSLVVFSGRGGEILREPVLSLGVPFVHAHAGWLPRFRGSTTIYYSMLERRECAVSVLLLERSIDAGPVLARRCYPLPPHGLDVDLLYDSAIRADLMVDMLRRTQTAGSLPLAIDTSAETAHTYFVIHPVLKHLALMSLPSMPGGGAR